MTTDTPNWRQLPREVLRSTTISNALRVLAQSVPPEGRPTRFRCEGMAVDRLPSGEFVYWWGSASAGTPCIAGNGDQVLEALKPIPAHGGSGAVLREWLAMWGWTPPPKRQASQPPPMII